jgi:transcriptional regulator with XRE-family HTH domain
VLVMTAQQLQQPVGELLRQWREHRRLSQLELALQAKVSARHLSFVETSRSRPSRELVLNLAEQLEIPLRERNHLLLAAGFAPVYAETALDSPELLLVRRTIRQVLCGHEPYPAVVVDRGWNVLDRNTSTAVFTAQAAPELLIPPTNVLRVSLHPLGLAPRIVNLGEWRAHLLGRLRRQIQLTADPGLAELYEELAGYPCDQPEPEPPGAGAVVVPLRVRDGDRVLSFFSTVATFGTPLDVTVAELVIESFYPADPETAALLWERGGGGHQRPQADRPRLTQSG